MTLVRQPAFPVQQQGVRDNKQADHAREERAKHGEEKSQLIAHLPNRQDAGAEREGNGRGQRQDRPSESMVDALAYQIANLSPKQIRNAVGNLARVAAKAQIPTDNPLATIGPKAMAAVYQRGSLRRMLYSQPLPGMLGKTPKACGISVSAQLRKRLEKFLANRPKKGFGYIIANGDLLDDLLEEAYEDCDEENRAEAYIAAFLEYNRHLGLSTPDALNAAVGQILFFPEMQELIEVQQILQRGMVPTNYPAIEEFLRFAGMPESAARMFHWVPPRQAAADSNLTTAGKPFAFSSPGFSANGQFEAGRSDIPQEWIVQNLDPEVHNARVNADRPFMRNLLASGRYSHIRA